MELTQEERVQCSLAFFPNYGYANFLEIMFLNMLKNPSLSHFLYPVLLKTRGCCGQNKMCDAADCYINLCSLYATICVDTTSGGCAKGVIQSTAGARNRYGKYFLSQEMVYMFIEILFLLGGECFGEELCTTFV